MKPLLHSAFIFALMACSCTANKYKPAITAMEGGREFIDACLKGDFEKAGFYMIDDSTNQSNLDKIKNDYTLKSSDERRSYASASIIIASDEALNDSTHIINYSNSYDKVGRKVKVIQRDGNWMVDFKYTFSGNL